jgi:hypothetical protein
MTLTTLPEHMKPMVEKAAEARSKYIFGASPADLNEKSSAWIFEMAETEIIAFLNACLQGGVAHEQEQWDGIPALILNLGEIK